MYEMASSLGFVGAGIQMAPNMARILDRLGVWDEIEKDGVVLNETSIRQGSTDGELTHVDLKYIKENLRVPPHGRTSIDLSRRTLQWLQTRVR